MFKTCPKCESTSLGDRWVGPGRMLQQYCYNCDWLGEARIPEQKEIELIKEITVGRFHGSYYEVFDRYGHLMISSRYYNNEKDAERELQRELAYGLEDKDAGPYKAVLWPATVIVAGKLYDTVT